MNVHEECIAAPASHFLDGEGVDAIEVHCHGSTSSEAVASYMVVVESMLVEV